MSTLDIIDLWREILVRLPGESVTRCRAVSKGWRAVIDDPCFIREHTNKNHQQQQLSSSKIIIQKGNSFYSLDLEALINSFSSGNYGHQAIAATPLHPDVINTNSSSSCNGLVLTLWPLRIWNPLTHERLELPPAGDRDSYVYRAIGLGYDGTTDDYKAVVILSSLETHVYSLRSDSWRRIINCPRVPDEYDPGVFVCGALNWLSKGEWGACVDDYKIVAMDLGNEKYRLLEMPRQKRKSLNFRRTKFLPAVLGGCLAVCDSGSYEESYLDVWVMKVYGEGDSWTKLFSIENNEQNVWSGHLRPAAFIMNERFVVLQDDEKTFPHHDKQKFFLFDYETKTFKRVKIDGSFKKGLFLEAQQMFIGTLFRLHANCGGVREICTTKRKKVSANVELVFCIRDANGEYSVSCSERGCRLPGENEDFFSLGPQ